MTRVQSCSMEEQTTDSRTQLRSKSFLLSSTHLNIFLGKIMCEALDNHEGNRLTASFIIYMRTGYYLGRAKRIWYLSPMRAAKVQASLRIRAVSPEPPLLAHTSSESRRTFRQKARFLALLNGWACAVKICHDGMLEDTNSLDAAHLSITNSCFTYTIVVNA